MGFEKKINEIETKDKEPEIEVIRSSEAPEEYKENPFYNQYHWGMADWDENKLYLPDNSDEAISFSIAAHELGHLVKEGRIKPSRFEFEPTYQEELRAWGKGWQYLEKYLPEYYEGNTEVIGKLNNVKDDIEKMFMDITKLSEPFYQKTNEDGQEQRSKFLKTDIGTKVKTEIDNLKVNIEKRLSEIDLNEFLRSIDWNKYKSVINKALLDIEKDNRLNEI